MLLGSHVKFTEWSQIKGLLLDNDRSNQRDKCMDGLNKKMGQEWMSVKTQDQTESWTDEFKYEDIQMAEMDSGIIFRDCKVRTAPTQMKYIGNKTLHYHYS